MSELLEHNPTIIVVDQILLQLKDLVKLENPERPLTEAEYTDKIAKKLDTTPIEEYGVWVHYPWRNQLVHMLDEEDFIRVRTIRNAYKITFEEQATLRTKKVGVIGLSVGQSVSLALAMERIAGEIRIADFDTLELSNLNRIRTGVHNMGTLKTVVVAREIAELDPFIKVVCFHNGITKENIDSFFDEGGRLDLLVEECDDGRIKLKAREEARERKVAVLMETSDRCVIDIERFDLDDGLPLLHGRFNGESSSELSTKLDSNRLLMKSIDFEKVSLRGLDSMSQIGKTITNWPQLATDVISGGAICAQVARRILLGEKIESNRLYAEFVI
jgi:molybdopterin/thiamine biosynthesis adenylyltransferase